MTTKMTTKTNKRERSRDWYERAQQSLIEGVNSPSRGAAVYLPGPVVLERPVLAALRRASRRAAFDVPVVID